MKSCPHCGLLKDHSEFGKETKNKDGLRSWCKECVKIDNEKRRTSNMEEFNASTRRSYARMISEIHSFLGGACAECGNDDETVLQVDHVNGDGNKQRLEDGIGNHSRKIRDNLRQGINLGWQLLCGNCHNRKSFYSRRLEWEILEGKPDMRRSENKS